LAMVVKASEVAPTAASRAGSANSKIILNIVVEDFPVSGDERVRDRGAVVSDPHHSGRWGLREGC
jgi:hypothetical protein